MRGGAIIHGIDRHDNILRLIVMNDAALVTTRRCDDNSDISISSGGTNIIIIIPTAPLINHPSKTKQHDSVRRGQNKSYPPYFSCSPCNDRDECNVYDYCADPCKGLFSGAHRLLTLEPRLNASMAYLLMAWLSCSALLFLKSSHC